jgi:hypothetical protein
LAFLKIENHKYTFSEHWEKLGFSEQLKKYENVSILDRPSIKITLNYLLPVDQIPHCTYRACTIQINYKLYPSAKPNLRLSRLQTKCGIHVQEFPRD